MFRFVYSYLVENVIIPTDSTDFHIFQRGRSTTNQIYNSVRYNPIPLISYELPLYLDELHFLSHLMFVTVHRYIPLFPCHIYIYQESLLHIITRYNSIIIIISYLHDIPITFPWLLVKSHSIPIYKSLTSYTHCCFPDHGEPWSIRGQVEVEDDQSLGDVGGRNSDGSRNGRNEWRTVVIC